MMDDPMADKASNHPIVRDLRRLLNRHRIRGAVLLGVTTDGRQVIVSAGMDVTKWDALDPILDSDLAAALDCDVDAALIEAD